MPGSQIDSRKSGPPSSVRAGGSNTDPPPRSSIASDIAGRSAVPRWRQIEILNERRALQEALDDFGDLDVELGEDVFGNAAGDASWFRSADDAEEETDDEAVGSDDEDHEPLDDD
jgi:hypothetical protein